MFPYLPIGPLSLPVPGLLLILGLWIGTSLSEHFSTKRSIESTRLYNLIMVVLISAVVGARLGFIARQPESYLANPLDALAPNLAAVDPWSAFAGGLLAWLIYSQRKQIPYLSSLDAITPLLAVEMLFIHLSNLASGAGFGSETNLPWGIELWGAVRHPVQAYEAAGALIILFLLWRKFFQRENIPSGIIFFTFLAMSASFRLFFEAFHGDSILVGNFRLYQLAAWGTLAVSLSALYKIKASISS